jgi:hypothetical protein
LSDVGFTSFRVFTFSIFAFWGSPQGRKVAFGAEMNGAPGCAKMVITCGTFPGWRPAGKRRIRREDLISAQLWHADGAVLVALGVKRLIIRGILCGKARERRALLCVLGKNCDDSPDRYSSIGATGRCFTGKR